MLPFNTDDLASGAKSARMEQRTTAAAKELIEQAAALLGINASEFTVAAAARAARDVLRDYEMTTLKPEAHRAFLAAVEQTRPSAPMVDLMRLHAEVTTEK